MLCPPVGVGDANGDLRLAQRTDRGPTDLFFELAGAGVDRSPRAVTSPRVYVGISPIFDLLEVPEELAHGAVCVSI
jgi:hypothetical protein